MTKKLEAKPKATAKKLPAKRKSAVMRHAATGATLEQEEHVRFGQNPFALSPVAAALRTFQRVSTTLGLETKDKLALLCLKHTKFFSSLKDANPDLTQDTEDRLGYFLVIVDQAAGLVGNAGDWLRSPNHAPLFGGKPPLDLLLAGRMEGMFSTLNYLRSSHGGWA